MSNTSGEALASHSYTELEIPEVNFGYLSHTDRLDALLALQTSLHLDGKQLLDSGIDGAPVRDSSTFGDRTETWTVTEDQFRQTVKNYDRTDAHAENPFYFVSTEELPAILFFDPDQLQPKTEGDTKDAEWVLRGGVTMDEAVLAVVYFIQSIVTVISRARNKVGNL